MQYTQYKNLKKPEQEDFYNVDDFNENADAVDLEIHNIEVGLENLTENKSNINHNHNNGADLTNVNASKLGGREPSAYALDGDLKIVAKTGNYNDLTNKPTTMPADGGNADTVDNKHAADFAAYSVISSGDFNNITTPGIYTMRSCSNAPTARINYYGLIVLRSDTGSDFEQMAFMEGTTKLFVRYFYGGNWSQWEEIGYKDATNIPTSAVNAASGNYTLNINASNVQNVIQLLAEHICSSKSSSGTLSSNLNSHIGASSGAHASSAISVDAITTSTYGDCNFELGSSNVFARIKHIYDRIAYSLDQIDGIKDAITPYPYSYSKIIQSLSAGNWYKLVLCNFGGGDKNAGGSAIITITAYNSSGKGQTIMCQSTYSGSRGELQVLNSVCRSDSSKVFDKVAQVRLNYGFTAFHTAENLSSVTININVQSSVSDDRADFKANDNAWSANVDGAWIWSHSGQHYWNEYDL